MRTDREARAAEVIKEPNTENLPCTDSAPPAEPPRLRTARSTLLEDASPAASPHYAARALRRTHKARWQSFHITRTSHIVACFPLGSTGETVQETPLRCPKPV